MTFVGLLTACANLRGGPPPSPRTDATRYEATATILESPDHGPMLCLGGIAESLPSQCGDVPITNWDWERVQGGERASGTTWGLYRVVGTFDGVSFTVEDVGEPAPPQFRDHEIGTPCPEAGGGWTASHPGRASGEDLDRATSAVRESPDLSGVWVDYPKGDPTETEGDTEGLVLNVAFTGDLDRHEQEIRDLWGGPLCLVLFEHTLAELGRIQDELIGSVGKDLGLQVLAAATFEFENVVEIEVVVIDNAQREELEARYGPSVVRANAALRPVS